MLPEAVLLLTPTTIYVKAILDIIKKYPDSINGLAHITGGGLIENIPRIIPDGLCANINKSKIITPEIFNYIQSMGVSSTEMWGTFNMGAGFIIVANPDNVIKIINSLKTQHDINAYIIGEIIPDTLLNLTPKICLT